MFGSFQCSDSHVIKRVFGVFFLLACAVGCASIETSKREKEALPAATEFLKFLDEGNYLEAAGVSSSSLVTFFTTPAYTSREHRVDRLTEIRKPLGIAIKRTLWGSTYVTTYPGKPDGQYLKITYETRFEKKSFASEYLLMSYENGAWVVTGYGYK